MLIKNVNTLTKQLGATVCLAFMLTACGGSGGEGGGGTGSPASLEQIGNSDMTSTRITHAATLLGDGTVLITGGEEVTSGTPNNSAEIFDSADGNFTALTNTLNTARGGHTATLLEDGTVLITGGYISENNPTDTAELYNPADGSFTPLVSTLTSPRFGHTATLLADGSVLITGGDDDAGITATVELYDPMDESFTALTSALTSARVYHRATMLDDGMILITGGADAGRNYLDTAEIFDPTDGSFTALPNAMTSIRLLHDATRLGNGTVLITGGRDDGEWFDTAEIYNPTNGSFTVLTSTMTSIRGGHTSTLLEDGGVLITGGLDENYDVLKTVEAFDPSNESFGNNSDAPPVQTGPPMQGTQSELQGTWNRCTIDPNDTSTYAEIVVSGNTINIQGSFHNGSDCTGTPVLSVSDSMQFTIGESVSTPSGDTAYEINTTGASEGDSYDIYYIDLAQNQLYEGDDENDTLDGSSPQLRPTNINWDVVYTKVN